MASRNGTESGVRRGSPRTDLFIVSLWRKAFPAVCFGFTLEHTSVEDRGWEAENEEKRSDLFVLLVVPSVGSHSPVAWCLALNVHRNSYFEFQHSAFIFFPLIGTWAETSVSRGDSLSEIPDLSPNLKDCSQLCEQLLPLYRSDIKSHSLSTRSGFCVGFSTAALVATTLEYARELALSLSGACSVIVIQLLFVNNHFKITLFWGAQGNALNLEQAFVKFKRLLWVGAGRWVWQDLNWESQ